MGKNKGYNSMIGAIFSMLFMIAAVAVILIFGWEVIKYFFAGSAYDAKVTDVYGSGSGQLVMSEYTAENGSKISAETICKSKATAGEEFRGYVISGENGKILKMPEWWKLAAFGGGFCIVFFGGLIGLIKNSRTHRKMRYLATKGTATEAEVTMINKRKEFVFDCYVSFTDSDGEPQTAMVTFTRSVPAAGSKYPVVYYKDAKGRLICEIIEL